MKKFLFSLLSLFLAVSLFGQSNVILNVTSDYSQFVMHDDYQTWQLQGVSSNESFTALFFRITVNKNSEGAFSFISDSYISGKFGVLHPVGLTVENKTWSLGKWYYYPNGNKGKYASAVLYFNRIPAGIDKISYCEPNFISWDNIPVDDNPDLVQHSKWNEESLRSYWESNKCSSIEGIYYFTNTTDKNWWGANKHTLAVIKEGYQYNIVYLKGSNKDVWNEGDIKASFVATATAGLYKATAWYMENRLPNEDFYIKFSEGFMSIYENTSNVSADFLKLYPANGINANGGIVFIPAPNTPSSPQSVAQGAKATGSGIFVGSKIIATNYHVIEDARKIEVSIKTGTEICTYEAKVLVSDQYNDLALISIDDEKFKGIGNLSYCLSSKLRDVGTSVFTMGYPLADYMGEEVKITDGIISSKTGYEGDIGTYQISAPIQPGNSGGPLFDKNGNLIGITNAGIKAAQNVGYAIKSSYLCNLMESAPITISMPSSHELEGKDLTEQIKNLSKYVVFIKIY